MLHLLPAPTRSRSRNRANPNMCMERETIRCCVCGRPIDAAQAADDFDAGVEGWNKCDGCVREAEDSKKHANPKIGQ